jgi:antitoxin (DNA-binding transcriptional repressor) of toxin-antitoxin stability system
MQSVHLKCTEGEVMTNVNVTEFRKNLPEYLNQAIGGKEIHVTRRGRIIATLSPPVDQKKAARKRLAKLCSKAEVGDVETPVDETWEALDADS